MRITTIRYAKLVNLGDYNNERFEATAEREEGENADEAAHGLAGYVDQMLADRAVERKAIADREARERHIAYLERTIREYTAELEKIESTPEDVRAAWNVQRAEFIRAELPKLQAALANPDAPEDNSPF